MAHAPTHHDDIPLQLLDEIESTSRRLGSDTEHLARLAMLGTLATSMAHELNNLLTPALGYVDAILARPDDADFRDRALGRIANALRIASHVTHSILSFGASTDGDASADPADVVTASLGCLAIRPEKRGVVIETSIDPGLRLAISPLALQQVVMNLVLNALGALRGRQGRVRITASRTVEGRICLSVSDNGCGISPERLETLFLPFTIDAARAADDDDVPRPRLAKGLGLSICKRIIDQHHGSIVIDSAMNEGTTISITLPSAALPLRQAS